MNTEIRAADAESINIAATLLKNHDIAAFPTETVYGLGAIVFDELAITKIYGAKGRPSDNPLIAHIADIKDAVLIGQNIPQEFYILAKHFFPGPLTLVVQKHPSVPLLPTAGLNTIGIRMPNHSVALELIRAAGSPLVAPSANLSGKPSPTSAKHVFDDLQGKIPFILDGGPCAVGIESTVLDLTQNPFTILRPGHVSAHEIEQLLNIKINSYSTETDQINIKSPGMKYRHYKPQVKIALLDNSDEYNDYVSKNEIKNSMLLCNLELEKINGFRFANKLTESSLYSSFRLADEFNLSEIIIFVDQETKNNSGIMNRILRAAE